MVSALDRVVDRRTGSLGTYRSSHTNCLHRPVRRMAGTGVRQPKVDLLTILAVVLAFSPCVVAFMFLKADQAKDARHAIQIRELTDRIQHPEIVQRADLPPLELPERETDQWAQVGTVSGVNEWLKADDDG